MPSQIVEYNKTEAALATLRTKYADKKFQVTTTDGMVEARKARAELREWRTGLEEERKKIKAPALERCKLIDAEAKRLTEELLKMETPIDETIKAEEQRKEKEKQAKIEAEKKRVSDIQEKLTMLQSITFLLQNKTSAEIEKVLKQAEATVVTEEAFQEFKSEADAVLETTLFALRTMLNDTIKHEEEIKRLEEEGKRIAEEREKLEQAKKEQEAKALEAELKLKEAKDAEEKRVAEERRKEEERISAERTKQEQRLKEEREKQEEVIRQERDRLNKEKLEAEARQKEMARQEAEIAEQKRKQEEREKALLEHRQRLAKAVCVTPTDALNNILHLAEDVIGYPDDRQVRLQIALIAEANIKEAQTISPEDVGKIPDLFEGSEI